MSAKFGNFKKFVAFLDYLNLKRKNCLFWSFRFQFFDIRFNKYKRMTFCDFQVEIKVLDRKNTKAIIILKRKFTEMLKNFVDFFFGVWLVIHTVQIFKVMNNFISWEIKLPWGVILEQCGIGWVTFWCIKSVEPKNDISTLDIRLLKRVAPCYVVVSN